MSKSKRDQIIVGALSVLVIPVLAGIVVNTLPDLRPYIWFVVILWILLFLSVGIYLLITIRNSLASTDVLQITSAALDDAIKTASKAAEMVADDPGLDNVRTWVGQLKQWINDDKTFMSVLKVEDNKKWKPTGSSEQIARTVQVGRLVVNLTRSIVIVIARRRLWEDKTLWDDYLTWDDNFVKLACKAYKVGVALPSPQEWNAAFDIAYELAQVYHGRNKALEARLWLHHMQECAGHIKVQPLSDEYKSKYLDVEGLAFRDFERNSVEARNRFERALTLARNHNLPLMIWQTATHLGRLESDADNASEAVKLYTEALTSASELKDPALKIECYQALGDLARKQKRFPDAYAYYKSQLDLAEKSPNQEVQTFYAHIAIARVLKEIVDTVPADERAAKVQEAYHSARKAYDHEQERRTYNHEQASSWAKTYEPELFDLMMHFADIHFSYKAR